MKQVYYKDEDLVIQYDKTKKDLIIPIIYKRQTKH